MRRSEGNMRGKVKGNKKRESAGSMEEKVKRGPSMEESDKESNG